jgi:hypothetical protein
MHREKMNVKYIAKDIVKIVSIMKLINAFEGNTNRLNLKHYVITSNKIRRKFFDNSG